MRNLRTVGAALLLMIVLLVGIAVGNGLSSSGSETPAEGFGILQEIQDTLVREHINRDSLDVDKLTLDAINGMLRGLDDPYAAYLSPERQAVESQDLKGRFEGIGAEVEMRDGKIIIVSPMPDTPAERAGMRPEDVILEINGGSTDGISLLEAVNQIRGPSGEAVHLSILHKGEADPIELTIIRDTISLTSVNLKMLVGRLAHVKITNFWESTNQELVGALEKVSRFQARGLILDLRNNPGGLVTSVVDVTNQFIDDGLVLYEVRGDGGRRDWAADSSGLATDIPIVVLVNEGSASGSEVMAGALMDHDRATIIGATTFGKGSVNTLKDLSDGSGLTFTIASWYTPGGTLIEGSGLEPDIAIEQPEDGSEDLQMDKAIEALETKLIALEQADGQA